MRGLFLLGEVAATAGALDAMHEAGVEPGELLRRHVTADWGELDDHDIGVNVNALRHGGRIMSAYTLATGTRLWVITEADRSRTTFLLPDEY